MFIKDFFQKVVALTAFVLIVAFTSPLDAESNWVALKSAGEKKQSPPLVKKLHSSREEILISYEIPGIEVKEELEKADGTYYHHISLPKTGTVMDVGKPELPQIGRRFAIPKGAKVKVEVLESECETLEQFNIYPAQKPRPMDEANGLTAERPAFEKDRAYYERDELYPSSMVRLDTPQVLRGLTTSIVRLIPFQFNPVTKQLRVYTSVKVKVSFIGGEGTFLEKEFRTPGSELFYSRLINFNNIGPFTEAISLPAACTRIDHSLVDEHNFQRNIIVGDSNGDTSCLGCHGFEHIIITDESYETAAKKLVTWNNQKGIMTDYVTTQNIGTSIEAIKSFIQTTYNKDLYKPKFVTFLGDVASVPPSYSDCWKWVTDLYYLTMDGEDDYTADIFYGRIPVSPGYAFGTVTKIINYEKNPDTSTNWYNNVLLASAGNDRVFDDYAIRHSDDLYELLSGKSYNCNLQYCMDPDDYFCGDGVISTAINSGVGIANHVGHGGIDRWVSPRFTVDDISQLTNSNMLPVMFSINCQSGSFQFNQPNSSDECLGERLLREPDRGVSGFIGATDVVFFKPAAWLMKGLYDAVWVDFYSDPSQSVPVTQLGAVLAWAKLFWPEHSAPDYDTSEYSIREQNELFHYLGDPTMNLRTALPDDLYVTHNSFINPGSYSFQVQVKDGSGNPISDAMVTLSTLHDGGGVYYAARGITDQNGEVWLTTEYQESGTATLTVTKYNGYDSSQELYNYKPYIATISVSSEPALCADSDGGQDSTVQGTCTDASGSHTDGCDSSTAAEEWYCTSSGGNCVSISSNCTDLYGPDYVCKDGVCVEESTTTTIQPFISICSPSSGDNLGIGYVKYIEWNSSGFNGNVTIELGRPSGGIYSFSSIESDIENTGGPYYWFVEGPAQDDCKIKISSVDTPSIFGESAQFNIVKPSITITSPAAGEDWLIGSTETIGWTSSWVERSVKIELGRPDGCDYSWSDIVSSASDDGIHDWPVEGPAQDNCIIRITTSLDNTNIYDDSEPFDIVECVPPVAVSPSGTISDTTPTFSWEPVSCPDLDKCIVAVTANEWYSGRYTAVDATACAASNPSVTYGGWSKWENPPSVAPPIDELPSGSYQWAMQVVKTDGTRIDGNSNVYFDIVVQTCSDSDGGQNYLVRGTCTDSGGSYTDGCDSSTSAEDWYCTSPSGNCGYSASSCTYLYGPNYVCENGACVEIPPPTTTTSSIPAQTCSDSDGGKNYLVRGTCTDSGGSYTDGCDSSTSAEDWYCTSPSGNCAYSASSCTYLYGPNYVCQNGACVEIPPPTTTTTILTPPMPPSSVSVGITYVTDTDESDGDSGVYIAYVQMSWSVVSGATKYRWKIGSGGTWYETPNNYRPETMYWWYESNTLYAQAGNSAGWSNSATKAYTVDISNINLSFWKDQVVIGFGATLTINGAVVPSSGSRPGSYVDRVHYNWGDGDQYSEWIYDPPFFPKDHWYLWLLDYEVTLTAHDNYGRWRKIRNTISVY